MQATQFPRHDSSPRPETTDRPVRTQQTRAMKKAAIAQRASDGGIFAGLSASALKYFKHNPDNTPVADGEPVRGRPPLLPG